MLLIVLILLSSIPAPPGLTSECAGYEFAPLRRQASRILEGTVVGNEQLSGRLNVVTVAVSRVWKGPVTAQAAFYVERVLDSPDVSFGGPRFFFGVTLAAQERVRLGLSETGPPALVLYCYSTPSLTPDEIRGLGRPRVVKR